MSIIYFTLFLNVSLLLYVDAFFGQQKSKYGTLKPDIKFDDALYSGAIAKLTEPSAVHVMNNIDVIKIPVPETVSSEFVISTYVRFAAREKNSDVPIVLLHGFDSSCLEFRRLGPILAAKSKRDVIALDILGWGFNDHTSVKSFGPAEKIAHLVSFLNEISGGKGCILGGASLGGAIAIILAVKNPEIVKKLVLIDAQGFIDGDGPKEIPDFVAELGCSILRSTPLRMFANLLAYRNKSYATWDAMLCGKLHCESSTWMRASTDFLKSGGFIVSPLVSQVKKPTLVLWGENDEILEPKTADRFKEAIPKSTVKYVGDCGHVPHLEQPVITADEIVAFLSK